MTFEEYQKAAVSFRTDTANNEEYLTLGLIAEVGEAAGKLAKRKRDGVWDEKAFIKELGDVLWFVANLADYWDNGTNIISGEIEDCFEHDFYEWRDEAEGAEALAYWAGALVFGEHDIAECLGEIMYNLAYLTQHHQYDLKQVAEINIAKLRDRQARGVIKGDGDER